MAFVERGWRSFLRTGDPDPTAWRGRMAGQLMTYEACTDPRAWCLSAADRRQHLIDIMRRGPEDLDSMLPLPTEPVVRREPAVERRRPEAKPQPAPAKPPPPPPPPPKTPPPKEAEVAQPKDVGVARVEVTEEQKPAPAEAPPPPPPPPPPAAAAPAVAEPAAEPAPAAEPEAAEEAPPPPEAKTPKERAGDFCASLSDLANEMEGMLDQKSVRTQVPRLYEICTELSRLAGECAEMQAQMSDRQSQAEMLVEAARAAGDADLLEEFVENYNNFDPMKFLSDIAQVRVLEDRLNEMREDSMVDDAEETDEAWELRNIVAQLENRLEYQDDTRMAGARAEDFSQTDYASQEEGPTRSYEPSEASSEESMYTEKRECDELRAIIANLQKRIETLESDKQDYRGRDSYEDREAASLREQVHNLSSERDNLISQLNNAKMELEALQQEKASLALEADAIRQEMGQLQGEHLAALDYIKSLEEATAECTMLKEENKRFEEKLQQSTREQGKLHHEVHRLQCIIRDVEDDRKRTLNQLERLSYAAEWAKVLQKVH